MKQLFPLLCVLITLFACTQKPSNKPMSNINQLTANKAINLLKESNDSSSFEMIERGVNNAAKFWTAADGSDDDFISFCTENFAKDPQQKAELFSKLQNNLEIMMGYYNKMSVALKMPIHVVGPELTPIDEKFGEFEPFAHFTDDMFSSKIAFITILNFPHFSLNEKNTLGEKWNREEWAYARMGDIYTSRVPAEITQNISSAITAADSYISAYNIAMGNLRNEDNRQLFPDKMKLISHWGLRDELKSNYANQINGLDKQEMIYTVMKHIVNQTIPEQVINNDTLVWKPLSNEVFEKGKKINAKAEPNTRYQQLFNIYQAERAADTFNPVYPTYIQRAFDQSMEVSIDEIETMFIQFISAPEVKQVASLIESRLGRKLRPFDIWYDGFKTRSTISEDQLSAKTLALYPSAQAFKKSGPDLLVQLGFSREKANEICSHIEVDNSRGAGHAWGAQMKGDVARLRTRLTPLGMDYKGFNIAAHEFGHNVEQTISLYDVDNYVMNGVPNTAFTEALAFVFQKRDLQLLGYKTNNEETEALTALDIFWGSYEIMGVSLVDIRTWKWLYENPNATVEELKETILRNAHEIWNQYYAPYLGEENSPILAVYSHMIDNPLYLPNYPYGHIIEFQLEQQFAGKNLGSEIQRIYPNGRMTPNHWMKAAVGASVSTEPLLKSTAEAVKKLTK